MAESTTIDPGAIARVQTAEVLDTLLREGARRLLQEALELEVQEYIDRFEQRKDDKGARSPREITSQNSEMNVRGSLDCYTSHPHRHD